MTFPVKPIQERRAIALEAIGHALLELAAIERESEPATRETFIDKKNSLREVGLSPAAFAAAAGLHFPAFRVSRRLTATREDVVGWLKGRTMVKPQPTYGSPPPPKPTKPTGTNEKSFDETLDYIEHGTDPPNQKDREAHMFKNGGDVRAIAIAKWKRTPPRKPRKPRQG